MRSKEKNMDLTSTENILDSEKKFSKKDKWADKPAMEVRDLHFSYGKNKVLKGVSLKIEEGKITTIMGANGCGKSTLFSLMTKNLYPRKGNIFLKGKNVQNLNLKEFARKVAIVQQYNSASDDITVENLVAFGRTPHKKMMQGDSAEDERMIQWALEVTNLTEYRDREVSRLSGGQRQRVWIAMALCQGTKTLFLDEPTIGLDAVSKLKLREFLRVENETRRTTILLTTHDMEDMRALCSRVMVLGHGQLLYDGTLTNLLHRYDTAHTLTVTYDGAADASKLPQGAVKDGDTWRITLQKDGDLSETMRQVMAAGKMHEMAIEEQNVDELIARMYREMAL